MRQLCFSLLYRRALPSVWPSLSLSIKAVLSDIKRDLAEIEEEDIEEGVREKLSKIRANEQRKRIAK